MTSPELELDCALEVSNKDDRRLSDELDPVVPAEPELDPDEEDVVPSCCVLDPVPVIVPKKSDNELVDRFEEDEGVKEDVDDSVSREVVLGAIVVKVEF